MHLGLIDEYFPVDAARFAPLYTDRVDPKVVALLTAYDAILLFSLSAILEKSMAKINAGNVFRAGQDSRYKIQDRCIASLFQFIK